MQSVIEAARALKPSKEEAWSEVVREIGVRERCFDGWVAAQKISWADARDRLARLQRVEQIMKLYVDDEHTV
jgi:antibiotic biosynthesis monooxygenase (ABM) superfamily enzyme